MMNKYQEALDRVLNHVNLKVAINDEHGLPKILRDNQGYQDLELMQKLVDKETPMKPKAYYSCPNCGCVVVDEYKYFDYCPDCVRKLDWGNRLEDTSD